MPNPTATLLIAGGNQANRHALARPLREAGFTVLEAAGGEEALRLARDLPDLILLDVDLADLSSREVCRRLKTDPLTAPIPVLQVMAGPTPGEDHARGPQG